MQPIRVVHIGVQIAEPGDGNGQVLYLLTIRGLEFGQDESVPVHPAEDLSDADLLRLADAVDIGDLDRGRRGSFGHSVPVPRVGFGGRQQLTGGIRAVGGGIGLVDPQATLIVLDDPDLRYRPSRRRLRRMGSWIRLCSPPLIIPCYHCAHPRMYGGLRYSIPRPPDQRCRSCRCATAQRGPRLSTRIQSRESLTRSGLLSPLMLHPAEKFHGSRATERLTTRLRPSRVGMPILTRTGGAPH